MRRRTARVLDSLERDQPDLRIVRLRPGFVFQHGSAAEQRPFDAARLADLLDARVVRVRWPVPPSQPPGTSGRCRRAPSCSTSC